MHTIKENPLVIERVNRLIDGEIYTRANNLVETLIKRDEEISEAFREAIDESNSHKISSACDDMLGAFMDSSYYDAPISYEPSPEWQVDLMSLLMCLIDHKSIDLEEVEYCLTDCPKGVQDLLEWRLNDIKSEVEYVEPLYHLIISSWLANKLKAQGEITFDMLGVHIWSVTDGSSLSDHWSLLRIASDLIA